MTSPAILGPLSSLHQMLVHLVENIPEADANRQFHPRLGSVAWYLGRCVYQELYWLREIVSGDADLSVRVEQLFAPGAMPLVEQCSRLPPKDHLLNWAAEIQEEHLLRLANPGSLPEHPLLQDNRLQWFLLQEQSRNYEYMLMVLAQRRRQIEPEGYRVHAELKPCMPKPGAAGISQGHYRVGSRGESVAYDNELPPQVVELSSFRINRQPVSNAEFLAFLESDGYRKSDLWTTEGRAWKTGNHAVSHPDHWRQDESGNWYAIGINGPFDLDGNEPVMGINQHEAKAYANWVSNLGGDLSGAVLPHEYQWEVASRNCVLELTGRVWEWCSNLFHPYPEFNPFPSQQGSRVYFDDQRWSLRGASIHTQKVLRRSSYRNHAPPDQRFLFAGTRLVFPPID
jgi:iron(II)-dependent oxidoreductase